MRCDRKSPYIFSLVFIGGGLVLVCGTEAGFDLGASGRVYGESVAIFGSKAPACFVEGYGSALVIVGRRGARARAYITGAAAWPLESPRRGLVPHTRRC